MHIKNACFNFFFFQIFFDLAMENTQLSNTRTNKELENELRILLIKKKEINFNLKKLVRKEKNKSLD